MNINNEVPEVIYPDPVHEDVVLEKNLYAEMRDGIKLAMDLYKPARSKVLSSFHPPSFSRAFWQHECQGNCAPVNQANKRMRG